jgi:integrase/recombinase XerD
VFLQKVTKGRGLARNWIIEGYQNNRDLSEEMKEKMTEFLLSLHGIKEDSKAAYISKIKVLGRYLTKDRGLIGFEDAKAIDLNLFLSRYSSEYTLNTSIYVIKKFYTFIKLPEITENLRLYTIQPEQITPSETLTPDEIIALANEASKRRELYKIAILVLFESCARISEVLQLKLGDVVFSSVIDKDTKKRKPIATLHFKRSKGGVIKQPVVLVMFASELKRWCDNHRYKGNKQAFLFPSPTKKGASVSRDSIGCSLWNAANRLGIQKRVNPHWLRHSGLSYFANDKNYNEQLLKWRAGWTNTSMAARYVHSGAELENSAYLERMGLSPIENALEPKRIVSKTCPHCQASNPYTNSNCDFCAMPLDLEEYKKEIEKRRDLEHFHEALKKTSTGKLTEEHRKIIEQQVDVVKKLIEYGYPDEAQNSLELLLTTWANVLLAK